MNLLSFLYNSFMKDHPHLIIQNHCIIWTRPHHYVSQQVIGSYVLLSLVHSMAWSCFLFWKSWSYFTYRFAASFNPCIHHDSCLFCYAKHEISNVLMFSEMSMAAFVQGFFFPVFSLILWWMKCCFLLLYTISIIMCHLAWIIKLFLNKICILPLPY